MSDYHPKLKRTVIFCGVLGVFTSGVLSAQEKERILLEEIIVTAQKRAESVQDVPISITAFSGDALEKSGAVTIEDVARLTPNFATSTSAQPTNNRITIRGIGSVGNNAIESSVGVFIDGVYYPRPGSIIGMLSDVASFEVLRGPQGTLYGRNTGAGALNITTQNPGDNTEGQVSFGVGDYGAVELGGIYNVVLSDTSSARFSAKYADRDGYGTNLFDGQEFGARDDLVLRGKLVYEPSDKTSLLITADYSELNVGGNAIEVLNSTTNPVFERRTTALYGASPITSDSYDWEINQSHSDKINDTQQGLALDVSYELSNGTRIRSITSYRDWEANAESIDVRFPSDLLPASTFYQTDTFSQEIQWMSADGSSVEWLTGLYFYNEDYIIDETRAAGADFCVPTISALVSPRFGSICSRSPQQDAVVTAFDQSLESLALFGQATWPVSDKLDVTLGVRWSDDKKEADFKDTVNNPAARLFRTAESTLGMQRNDSKVTGLANLQWRISEDAMIFATASTGYKSGGFNSQGGAQALGLARRVFAPEETTNYELGVKSTLMNGAMTANATLYRTELKDFQDRTFDGLSFVVLNAGELRQQGIELDVNWVPTDALSLLAGVSYLDSEYLDFRGAPPLPGGSIQDLTGQRRNNSPRWQASLSADYTKAFSENLEWFAGGSWSWVDEQNVGASSNNNPQSVQGAYAIVNVRLGMRSVDDKWDLTLHGRNVTDEDHCQTMFDQGFGGPLGAITTSTNSAVQRCALSAPTTWMLRANYRF